jgi:hypothetical protein
MTMAKVLVVVTGRDEETVHLARRLGRALEERGATVDLVPLGVDGDRSAGGVDVGGYGGVVLGSGVLDGRWLDDASRFAAAHSEAMCGRPVWLFSRTTAVGTGGGVSRVDVRGLAVPAEAVRHLAFGWRDVRPEPPRQGRALPAGTSPEPLGEWRALTRWACDIVAAVGHAAVRAG